MKTPGQVFHTTQQPKNNILPIHHPSLSTERHAVYLDMDESIVYPTIHACKIVILYQTTYYYLSFLKLKKYCSLGDTVIRTVRIDIYINLVCKEKVGDLEETWAM